VTIILVPGFFGHSQSFEQVRAGLPGTECCTVLPAGHGDPGAVSCLSYEHEVSRLAERIAGFPAPRVLVGYSMGGRLSLSIAVAHPALADRLVLVSARDGLASHRERALRREADEVWARRLSTTPLSTVLDAWEAQPIFGPRRRLPRELCARERQCRLAHDPHALAGALRALGLSQMPYHGERLSGLALPVQLLAGGLDGKFVQLGRQLARLLPQARLSVVSGVGHDLVMEAPEIVAKAIIEGLDP